MRFFTRIALLFYFIIIFILGGSVVLFANHVISLREVNYYLSLIYNDPVIGLSATTASLAVVLISFIFARVILNSQQKEKTIAFDNPSGRVSVSLNAVEDLVRRLMYKVPEVKEVKPSIIASKKGVNIEARLILKSDVNIPETTSQLQELIKNKIQEILGLDEKVSVRIHIVKIISEQSKVKPKNKEEEKEEAQEPTVPFQGYRN